MFDKLQIFQLVGGMARHAGVRQNVIAQNIANTDTPGYKSQDITPFAHAVEDRASFGLRSTRSGHVTDGGVSGRWEVQRVRGGSNQPNGNSVSVETEMVKAAETQQQHATALNVYRSAMDILTISLGQR
ncbi:MAG: FlgB family protein [Pseudomonadota bacterium]